MMEDDEKNKLAHEALYRELHQIDDLVEKHSQLVLAISAALFVFAGAHLHSPTIIWFAATFGVISVGEWILKIIRHRRIFRSIHEKLAKVELAIGIETLRPLKKPYPKLFSLDGFTILLWLAIILITFWLLLSVLVSLGFFDRPEQNHSLHLSEIVDKVESSLPGLSGVSRDAWQLQQIQYHPQMQSYEFAYHSRTGQETVRIMFDGTLAKIVTFQHEEMGKGATQQSGQPERAKSDHLD